MYHPDPGSSTGTTSTSGNVSVTSGAMQESQYVVKLLNFRIKKYHGCGSEFACKTDGSLPDPPMNIVIINARGVEEVS